MIFHGRIHIYIFVCIIKLFLNFRARNAREIRFQTDLRISVGSLTYSPLYGNKVRKLWKVLAKNNELTDASYDFLVPQKCKVVDCKESYATAMDMFRHVREAHLSTVKKLKIKIGTPPPSPSKLVKRSNKPGPRSKTMVQSTNYFPFPVSYLGSAKKVASKEKTSSPVSSPPKLNIDHDKSAVDANTYIDVYDAIAASEAVLNTSSNEVSPNTSLDSSFIEPVNETLDESYEPGDESVDDGNVDSSLNSSVTDISYDASSSSAY